VLPSPIYTVGSNPFADGQGGAEPPAIARVPPMPRPDASLCRAPS